jgi:hypothetical protein
MKSKIIQSFPKLAQLIHKEGPTVTPKVYSLAGESGVNVKATPPTVAPKIETPKMYSLAGEQTIEPSYTSQELHNKSVLAGKLREANKLNSEVSALVNNLPKAERDTYTAGWTGIIPKYQTNKVPAQLPNIPMFLIVNENYYIGWAADCGIVLKSKLPEYSFNLWRLFNHQKPLDRAIHHPGYTTYNTLEWSLKNKYLPQSEFVKILAAKPKWNVLVGCYDTQVYQPGIVINGVVPNDLRTRANTLDATVIF